MTDRTQSLKTPAIPEKLYWQDLGWLIPFALRGSWELVRARLQFTQFTARNIVARNQRSMARTPAGPTDAGRLARIAYVLPRISGWLPWRSDCLIQAMAGQNWLDRNDVASEIQIGVERPKGAPFGAHAWLVCDGMVVTGGDVARYHVLLNEAESDRSRTRR